MPSVQELLAVLEADKSPLQSLVEGLAGGYADARKTRIDDTRKLLEIDQLRQQMAQEKQMRDRAIAQDQKLRAEQQTNNALRATGSVDPVLPSMKLKRTIEEDPKTGLLSEKKTYQTEDPKPAEFYTPDQARVLLPGKQTEDFIKTFPSGQIPKDAVHQLLSMNRPPSFVSVGSQDGALVMVNPKTLEAIPVKLPGNAPLMSTTQTEGQANAKLYATRMEEADKQIGALSEKYDFTSAKAGLQGLGITPNIFKSEEVQSYEQSKRNFLNAVLRRESGAVISPKEMEEGNKQYFPVFGDSDAVLKQKEQNRLTATEGLKNAAGEAPSPKANGKTQKIGRFTVEVHN